MFVKSTQARDNAVTFYVFPLLAMVLVIPLRYVFEK